MTMMMTGRRVSESKSEISIAVNHDSAALERAPIMHKHRFKHLLGGLERPKKRKTGKKHKAVNGK